MGPGGGFQTDDFYFWLRDEMIPTCNSTFDICLLALDVHFPSVDLVMPEHCTVLYWAWIVSERHGRYRR
jgi:hypothetical protein